MRVAEGRRAGIVRVARSDPSFVTVGMPVKPAIMKIAVEQAEFPEVMRDVFADVGDRAGGADDDLGLGFFRRLVVFLGFFLRVARGRKLHDPATGVFPRGRELDGAALLQHFEGGVPEFQVQDFAFAREQIVIDAEAVERAQVAVHDGGSDDLAHFGRVAVAFFDVLERFVAQLQAGFILGEKVRDAGVKIPAEIIEPGRVGESLHFGEGFLFEVKETEDDVGNLHAGIVDVILDLDAAAGVAQETRESVAQDGVAHVANVRGFVGIDAGVFDHRLRRTRNRRGGFVAGFFHGGAKKAGAVEK